MERMNEPATVTDAARRLHPGPLVAVGRGRGRSVAGRAGARRLRRAGRQGDCDRRRQVPAWSPPTCAPNRAGVGGRQRQPARRRCGRPSSPTPHATVPPTAFRRRADRRAVQRARRAAAAARCTMADPARVTCAELAALQRRMLESSRCMVRPGGRLVYSVCTLTAVGVDRPSDPGRLRDRRRGPTGRHVATVPARLAGAPAGRRHRRHGPDSVPSAGHERRPARSPRCSRSATASSTASATTPAAAASPPTSIANGYDVVEHRVTADGADAVADVAQRDERRLRRPDRHHRRHRASRPATRRPRGPGR